MTSLPPISVILPVFNAANTLRSAVESILKQTFHDFEFLIIDDGSTDQSLEILSRIKDARIKILRQKHAGIAIALNAGLAAAQGEFIARMDADDLSLPERFARQLALIESDSRIGVVGCRVEMFPANELTHGMKFYLNWLNSLLSHEEIVTNLFVETPLAHPTMFFRKAALIDVGGYRAGDFPEDYDLLFRLHEKGWRFSKSPTVLYQLRDHPQRLSRTNSAYSEAAFRRLKAFYLFKNIITEETKFSIWGAGRDGKKMCAELLKCNRRPGSFIDIDPKKIGGAVREIPVLSYQELSKNMGLVLVCVGTKGARDEIRTHLRKADFVEGDDFICVA